MAGSLLCFILFLAIPISISGYKTTSVVSKDGSGDYRSISKAVSAIPNSASATYIIHIKRGIYNEAVDVGMYKNSVVFLGDGIDHTMIQFNKSTSTGIGTDELATVNIEAQHFVAKDISFVNSAGVNAGQAVAVRSVGLNHAFYRCSFKGYQDTLFMISGRKFFYKCNIFGTLDFIFGDAGIMFQNCNIYGRNPENEGLPIIVTAESRGISNSEFSTCTLCTYRRSEAESLMYTVIRYGSHSIDT
ncbi:probable pectinesterase/pectinesterase inhibitor 40 [Cornus florida]|uniref:probable pectinesterase/pectinesterase inhibitor 40 n=1 Tax=Cornus florida TaxID=4283 RepID=UPI00289EF78B|nr:probable pectinesterase/pectinesterase inhibitor 40 [Cornus florida]